MIRHLFLLATLILMAPRLAAEPLERMPLKLGGPRLLGQPWTLTEIPAELLGHPAIVSSRGPSDVPGRGYTVDLTQATAVYIGVHRRGQPDLPDRWHQTGLTIRWNDFTDDVYVTIAEPGTLAIPEHSGQAGLYGVPHLAILSEDLDTARALIENPKQPPPPPPRLLLRMTSDTPGLYALGDEELAWRFALSSEPSDANSQLTVTVRRDSTDGEVLLERQVAITGTLSEEIRLRLPEPGFYVLQATAPAALGSKPYLGGLARLEPPGPTQPDSPWGTMRATGVPWEAAMARRLGVSWLRHTTWATGKLTIAEDGTLSADFSDYVELARRYREQGIHIMGNIQMVPQALSSQPDNSARSGDAGPMYVRVAPRNWAQWESYVEQLVRQSDGLISHWEIGNEPNTPHHYWAGSIEEFASFVQHTGSAIRRVDPDATILFAGFTLNPDGPPYLDRLLELGCAPYMDALSIHSLYGKARSVEDMKAILTKHGIGEVPIWSTEPKQELPIRNFAAGIRVNMHFLLTAPGVGFYSQFRNLSTRDGSATRAGVIYANAARLIGAAHFQRLVPTGSPDAEAAVFDRDGHALLAINGEDGPRDARLIIRVVPGPEGAQYITGMGTAVAVPAGEFAVPLDRSGFVVGLAELEIIESRLPSVTAAYGTVVDVANAELTGGFRPRSAANRPSYAAVWSDEGEHEVRFPISLDAPGTYEVYSVVQWAERGVGQLVSPFSWWVDGRPATRVTQNLSMHWRDSTRSHLRFAEVPAAITDTAQGRQLHRLGVVRHMTAGDHTLRIRLDAPRAHDQKFSMEIEHIVLRPIADDKE